MKKLILILLLSIFIANFARAEQYIVQGGDNLRKIAVEELGDESRWLEIATLNNIKKPYAIIQGQILKLPGDKGMPTSPVPSMDGIIVMDAADSGDLLDIEKVNFPSWVWGVVSLVVFWIFGALCLKAGCWFSLVEASFFRCIVFSLVSSSIFVLCAAGIFGLAYWSMNDGIPWLAVPITAGIFWIIYLITMVIFMKRFLDCKWRSVVTVSIMTLIISNILSSLTVFGISFSMPEKVNKQSVEDFVQAMMKYKEK